MAQQLCPRQGRSYLEVGEVVHRLRSAFPFVNVDQRKGMEFLGRRVAGLNPRPPHAEIDRTLEALVDTAEVIVADDRHSERLFLKTFVVPGEPIIVAYCYPGHQEHARQLLVRFAAALGYEVVGENNGHAVE